MATRRHRTGAPPGVVQVSLQLFALTKVSWVLLAPCWLGCTQPVLWPLPAAPEAARTYAVEVDGAVRHLLLGHAREPRRALAEVEGHPVAVAYYTQDFDHLATPDLLLPVAPLACDRSRPLLEQALAAYQEAPSGEWEAVADGSGFGRYRLPPIPLNECLAAGCLDREGSSVVCKTTCETPSAPQPPVPAACPQGWLPSGDGSAGCVGPDPSPCVSEPCWLSSPEVDVGCRGRPRPSEATQHLEAELSSVSGVVWLPRGRYQGPVVLEPGSALYGECPEETVVVGGIRMSGSATVAALTVEVSPDGTGLQVSGRDNRVRALRVIGGRVGLAVAPSAEVQLRSARFDGARTCVNTDRADLLLDHFWCSKPSFIGLAGGGDIEVNDAVLENDMKLEGGWIVAPPTGDTARGRLTGRRILVSGPNYLAIRLGQAFDLSDLRIDGDGEVGTAVQIDGRGAVGQVRNIEATGLYGPAVWVRDHSTARISDLRASDVHTGLALTSSVTLRRVHVEDSRVEGLEGSDDLNLDVQDLRIVGAVEGLRVAPDRQGTQAAKLRRVLIEGAAIGLARSGGPVLLEEVVVRDCLQGVRASACLIDEVLSQVRLEDVATPVLYDDP